MKNMACEKRNSFARGPTDMQQSSMTNLKANSCMCALTPQIHFRLKSRDIRALKGKRCTCCDI